jgi:hypothetical protein
MGKMECGMRNAEGGMWNAEWGMGIEGRLVR